MPTIIIRKCDKKKCEHELPEQMTPASKLVFEAAGVKFCDDCAQNIIYLMRDFISREGPNLEDLVMDALRRIAGRVIHRRCETVEVAK